MDKDESKLKVLNFNANFGEKQILYDISLEIPDNRVTAIIGPSGCGKSIYYAVLNRMNDFMKFFSW